MTGRRIMTADEIRARTQGVWDEFYSWSSIWRRSKVVNGVKGRLAFMMVSKLYRQMYANTGIATDSARHERSVRIAAISTVIAILIGYPMAYAIARAPDRWRNVLLMLVIAITAPLWVPYPDDVTGTVTPAAPTLTDWRQSYSCPPQE